MKIAPRWFLLAILAVGGIVALEPLEAAQDKAEAATAEQFVRWLAGGDWTFTGNLAVSFAHLRFALRLAPLAPFLFALLARQAAESWRHDEEWVGLEIDG